MCLIKSQAQNLNKWNWDGDQIVHDTIIRGARKTPHKNKEYELDIRELLMTKDNAVVRKVLKRIIEKLNPNEKELFGSRDKGSFDFRIITILNYITQNIQYSPKKSRHFDFWQTPEETIANKSGDCEDRAFLLAALMLASGVSGYAVRVCLGKLYHSKLEDTATNDSKTNSTKKSKPKYSKKGKSNDHIWVMYKTESGKWILLEPLLFTKNTTTIKDKRKPTTIVNKPTKANNNNNSSFRVDETTEEIYEYIPYYLFNSEHLWSVGTNVITKQKKSFSEQLSTIKFMKHFDPAFATTIHNNLLDEALSGMSTANKQFIKMISLAMDTVEKYDPREHFDNGYIAEGWELLRNNLSKKTLDGLARACHAVADFYAHTSYANFAKVVNGKLELYDGSQTIDGALNQGLFRLSPNYSFGDYNLFNAAKFSINTGISSNNRDEVVATMNSKGIISGRFAQPQDPQQSFLEKYLVEIPYAMRHAPDFSWRAMLPHHNEVAVDSPNKDSKHMLYIDTDYIAQFNLRKDAAKRHITKLYEEWKSL